MFDPRLRAPVALCLATVLAASCRPTPQAPSAEERRAIADTIRRTVVAACDLARGDVVARLMSLYPERGRVVSTSGGRVVTTRDSLAAQIRDFWQYVGQNMRGPTWTWDAMEIDVLGRDAAVMTARYHIPHHTPAGAPHVVGGVWTAVFERRGGRWVIVQEHLTDVPM